MTGVDTRARLPVSINGARYEIDVQAYRRAAVDATRQLNDQGGEVGEQTLNSEYVWKRTAEDWRLGAGQSYFDLVEESSRRRFFDSVGINPWNPRSLTLLPEATPRHTETTGVPAETWLFVVGGQLVYARNIVDSSTHDGLGYAVSFVANPVAATWDLADIISDDTGAIESLCSDGAGIYYKLVAANQLRKITITGAGTWETANIGDNANTVTNLRIVAGRLLGQTFGTTDYLREVKAASDVEIASWDSGQMPIITGVCFGPNGIYMSGVTNRVASSIEWAGVHSTIYRSTIDESSGALTVPAPISALPDGEAVTSMLNYSGYMVLGTSQGVRLARWTATGGVEFGPVILVSSARDAITNATESPNVVGTFSYGVQCFEGEGQFVWFGWADKRFREATGNTVVYSGLGRLDLSRFVNDLQPAYATDLMIEGYDRPIQSVVSFRGRRYFTPQLAGPYGEGDNVVERGTVVSGPITFGTPEAKRCTTIELRTAPLPDGTVVDIDVCNEYDELTVVDGHAGARATARTVDVSDVAGESTNIYVTLARGWVPTEAPELRRWTLRAVVIPERQEEIWLPIVLHDTVTHEGGQPVALDPHGEFADLRALMEARSVVPLVMGNEAVNVFIDSIATGADTDVKLRHWNDKETWPEGVWFVKCITV